MYKSGGQITSAELIKYVLKNFLLTFCLGSNSRNEEFEFKGCASSQKDLESKVLNTCWQIRSLHRSGGLITSAGFVNATTVAECSCRLYRGFGKIL